MAKTPEQMRTHAQEVVRKDFISLSNPERDKLEEEYKNEWESINDTASIEANKLRLVIYANILDSDHEATRIDEKNWILSNMRATQILINAIQPWALFVRDKDGNVISEWDDNIFGPRTQRCIKDIFGIDIPLSQTLQWPAAPISTVAWAVSATVNEEGETVYELPSYMQDEEQLRGMLEQLGINGLRIENGKLIGRMELDTQEKLRKLEQYLDYANYIESVNPGPDAAGKVRRYKELLDDGTDFIWDKQYLIQKYIVSIYKDLVEVGCTIRQDGVNGEYVIAGMRDKPEVERLTSKYDEVISGGYARTAYIEFARIYGMVESSNNPRFHEQAVTREWLVMHILENNSLITWANGLQPQIQSIEWLLIHKDSVVEQLAKMIAGLSISSDDPNFHHYQEVIWLHDFLKHENYKQDDIQKDVFNQVNHYKNVFLKEQSFIDALTAEGIDPDNIDPNDNTTLGKLEKILWKGSFGLYVIGLLMVVFNSTRKWWFGLILGTMAAKAGLGIANDATQEFWDTWNTVWDEFDMFNPINLRHMIEYPDTFNRDNYDTTLTKLFDENDTRRKDGEVVNGSAVNHTNNAKIAFIFEAMMKDGDVLSEEFASADTATLVSTIHGKLWANPEVTETSFNGSTVPSEQRGPVEESDVQVFVELLRKIWDGDDVTIWDLLFEWGIDKIWSSYSTDWFSDFTEYPSSVDAPIHDIFRTAWDAPTATRKTRSELLQVAESFETHLYSGLTDTNWATSNVANVSNPLPSLWDKQQKLGDLENLINASSLDSTIKTNLIDLLSEYKTLLEKQDEFDNIKGPWYEVHDGNRIRFQNLTSWLRGQDQNETSLEKLRIDVETDISRLETLLASLPAHSMYNDLKNSIQDEINYLNVTQGQIIDALKANATVWTIIDATWAPTQSISDPLGLGKVNHVATQLHGALKDSIDASIETSVFGVTESDLRAAIIDGYQDILDGSINGINSWANITVNTWNQFRWAIQNSLAAKLNGSIVSNVIGTIPPIGVLPAANTVIVNGAPDRATIDQITAQIQLQILERYFADQENNLDNIQKLRDAYLPKFTAIMTGGGSLTPEQERLSDLITTDYEALLADIEAKVKDLADNYEGASIATTISNLQVNAAGTPPAFDSTNLDNFGNVAQFLTTASSNNTQITFLQNQVDRHFGTPNTLTGILVPSTQLQIDFEVKKDDLQAYVESLNIVDANPGGYIETMTSTADITDNKDTLKRVQVIIWVWESTIIDSAITALEERFNEIATVNQIPIVKNAIDADIVSLIAHITDLDNQIAAARLATTPTTSLEDSKHEAQRLLTLLRDAIDTTPMKLSHIRLALNKYTDRNWITRAYTWSLMTIDEVLRTI